MFGKSSENSISTNQSEKSLGGLRFTHGPSMAIASLNVKTLKSFFLPPHFL
jgi:hypothetical protein